MSSVGVRESAHPLEKVGAAAALVDGLVRAGIDTIFGLPGDTGIALYDALYFRTAHIRHVLARDERHAVAMADAYARITNRVGVVEVSSGGGTTYAVGGLGEAYASGVPLLIITSDISMASRGTGALTEIDQVALFKAVTKAQFVVEHAEALPGTLQTALRETVAGRPAPVVLIVPEDVLDDVLVRPPEDTGASLPPIKAPWSRPAADLGSLDDAVRRLSQASRPAALVGGGVHVSSAYAELADLATALGVGVATTIHGKGAIADTHRCALGVAGNNGGTAGVNAYLAESDVVLLVGTRANATDTDGFTAPSRDSDVIAVDIDADRVGRNYPNSLNLIGDAATVLAQLSSKVAPVTADELEHRSKLIALARALYRPEPIVQLDPDMILASDVIRTVQALCPADTIVTVDPGTPTPNIANHWRVNEVGRRILIPRGHGPMGYAVPAAIGAAFAHPQSVVVSFTADGSFAMCCGELETIARYALPITIIVFTNGSLGWIKMLQHLYMGERYFHVDPGPIDAVAVARACGLAARRVATLDDLGKACSESIANRQPTLIDVRVPHVIDVVPPVPAWHRALDGDNARPLY